MNANCPLCKKKIETNDGVEAHGLFICMDCLTTIPDLENVIQKYFSENPHLAAKNIDQRIIEKGEEKKTEVIAKGSSKAFQRKCYMCKKPLDSNQAGSIEGLCNTCSEKSNQIIKLDSTQMPQNPSVETHCKVCKNRVDSIARYEDNEGGVFCEKCFFQKENEWTYEGALDDKDFFDYVIFGVRIVEDSVNSENYKTGYIHFDKKNLKNTKAYLVDSARIEIPKACPDFFSSVVSLTPYQFLITGGFLGKFCTPLKTCLALVFDKEYPFFNFEFLDELKQERYGHSSVILDNQLYVLGGITKDRTHQTHNWLSHCEKFYLRELKDKLDPMIGEDLKMSPWSERKGWESIASLNKPRSNFNAFAFKGKIYAFGGFSGIKILESSIERYNPSQNKWELLNYQDKLNKINCKLIASSLLLKNEKDQIYILGGTDGASPSNQAFMIKPQEPEFEFEKIDSLKRPRASAQGFYSEGALYVFGGELSSLTIEKFETRKERIFELHELSSDLDEGSGVLGEGFIGCTGFYVE